MSGELQAAIAHAQAAQARSQGYRDATTRYDPSEVDSDDREGWATDEERDAGTFFDEIPPSDAKDDDPVMFTVRVEFDLEALSAEDAAERVSAALEGCPAPLDRPLRSLDVWDYNGVQVYP